MAKRHLGQNFLHDPSILKRIIDVAELNIEDVVIEIGPGHGVLTKMLAGTVKRVIAIELDEKLYGKLKTGLAEYRNVELIHGDALKYPYENFPDFKVVANIPYYITTPLIFRFFEAETNLKSMTLTVQKEVAERIVAKPGGKDYGVLSVMVQYYAEPVIKFIIPKGAFRPVPKVDSAVIRVRLLEKPAVDLKDEKFFFKIVRTSFSQRRKMLSNSLKGIGADVKGWLTEAGIDPERRPETLSIEEFARLANVIN
jgi:16S rRNA (adenine1518-N6/adenine1519-N6)-dimethyltransferase